MEEAKSDVNIFVSYAHEDDDHRRGITAMLSEIPDVVVWDDRAIPPGSDWDADIASGLDSADIMLLLISREFMNSEYVKNVEIKAALERRAAGTLVVIPVLLRSCIWKPRFGKIQALPSDENKPEDKNWVTSDAWYSLDEAYTHVAQGVMRRVEDLVEKREHQAQLRRDAEETYRKKVAQKLSDGHISDTDRDTLDDLRADLNLSQEQADRIEKGELRPTEERQKNLERYERSLRREILKGYPFSDEVASGLKERREDLLLTDHDVADLQERVVEEWQSGEVQRLEEERKAQADQRKAQEEEDRKAQEERDRRAKEQADREARAAAEQAAADAWHHSLAAFLTDQLAGEQDYFRLQPEIPDKALEDAVSAYEVPRDETVVGMFGDFEDDPGPLGVLFGRRGLYFNAVLDSDPGPRAILYASVPARDSDLAVQLETQVGDDVYVVSSYGTTVTQLLNRLGDYVQVHEAALTERTEPLDVDETEEFARHVFDEWKANQKAQEETEQAWAEKLVEFLLSSDNSSLFVDPDISERKSSNAWARFGMPEDESLLGLLDETAMGSAKNGLAFGVRGLYFHNAGGSTSPGNHFVEYSSLPARKIEKGGAYEVDLGHGLSYNTLSAKASTKLLVDLQAMLEEHAG